MLCQVTLKQLEYHSTRISSSRNRTECFRSTRRIVWITHVCWWNRLSCRSDGSAVFRLMFCPRISSTQTGKSEATRPSRVCEPVPINREPVVLYRRLASCAVRLSGCQPAVLYCCQRASCTACFRRERIKSERCCLRTFHCSSAGRKVRIPEWHRLKITEI